VAQASGDAAASAVRILYGGSVKAGNAAALLEGSDVDGALVGGASLDAAGFASIVKAAM
jgi:triosephosphate isomerase